MRIPPDLQELIDREAQGSGITRQKKLVEIIESYFEVVPETPERSSALMVDSLKEQLTSLEEHYAKLEADYEWLRGVHALAITKLLPAAEKIETPWWVRLGRRFRRKKA